MQQVDNSSFYSALKRTFVPNLKIFYGIKRTMLKNGILKNETLFDLFNCDVCLSFRIRQRAASSVKAAVRFSIINQSPLNEFCLWDIKTSAGYF